MKNETHTYVILYLKNKILLQEIHLQMDDFKICREKHSTIALET